jgi:nicotinamidase-related amidase
MRKYTDRSQALDCSAIIDELPVSADDTVIIKYGYNAFHRTGLTSVLLNSGIDTIVVTGTVTQVCVEDTVRGGYHEGFKVALVTDAVSSYDAELHAASIRNLGAHWCRLVTSDEILSELDSGAGSRSSHSSGTVTTTAPHDSVGSSVEAKRQ